MWSPIPRSGSPRNRVSPAPDHSRQIGHTNGNLRGSPMSVRGVRVDINKTPDIPSSTLTTLIRKRKFSKKNDNTLSTVRGNGDPWTPHLSERIRNKHAVDRTSYSQKSKADVKKNSKYCRLDVWQPLFNKIEAHQGTGVLSYFIFLKWMIWLNLFLSVLILGFIVLPYSLASRKTDSGNVYTTAVTGTGISGVDDSQATACSFNYDTTISSFSDDPANLIQDFIQGTGWIEQEFLYQGYYDAAELDLGASVAGRNLNYVFPFGYFMTVLGVLFFSLVYMAGFIFSSSTENAEAEMRGSQAEYCNKVFISWEYTIKKDEIGLFKSKSIHTDLLANLNFQRHQLLKLSWTGCQKCKMYTIRFLINLLILCMLGGAGYLIYYVNEWSTDYLQNESSSGGFLIFLVQFLPSLTITALNIILPLMFMGLVTLEDYSADVVINITLTRTVFLRLASLVMLVISLYAQINCSDKETLCNVNQNNCPKIMCWETYVGQAFYKLMIVDFFVKIIVTFLVELPRKLITTKCCCQKIGPAEFNIPASVLDLVYTQALCWMGFFYCPMLAAMAFFSLFIIMFVKLFSALYTTQPPEKPYKASKSNSFFIFILFITFVVCCVPATFSVLKIKPSRGCGPFRIYDKVGISVDTTIDSNWFSSASLIVGSFLIIFLSLIVVFCCVRGSNLKKKARVLEQQLLKENREKQYYMEKVFSNDGRSVMPRKNKESNGLSNGTRRQKHTEPEDEVESLWF